MSMAPETLADAVVGIMELPPAGDRDSDLQDEILGVLEAAGIAPKWQRLILTMVEQAELARLATEEQPS